MRSTIPASCSILAMLAALACAPGSPPVSPSGPAPGEPLPLPTGRSIGSAEETGPSIAVGNMPLAMAATPDAGRVAVLLSGWREQGLQVVDLETRRVVQTLPQEGAFLGLAFSPDGTRLFASGGNEDVVYRYGWKGGEASLVDRISLAADAPGENTAAEKKPRYPSGLRLLPRRPGDLCRGESRGRPRRHRGGFRKNPPAPSDGTFPVRRRGVSGGRACTCPHGAARRFRFSTAAKGSRSRRPARSPSAAIPLPCF